MSDLARGGVHSGSDASMHHRIGAILTGTAVLSLALAGTVLADSVSTDADLVVSGNQSLINLGTVAAGSTHTVDIGFDLICTGTSHVAVGSNVALTPSATAPAGGSISASTGTIGPVPPTWPAPGQPCIDDPVLRASSPSHVSLTAPATAGSNLVYRITYARSPGGGTTGTTLAQIVLSVAANGAPVLDLPRDMTVEGNATGGWTGSFPVSASDAEDDPDPDVDCTPATGDLLPLGTTTVECAVTDTAGATASGSFHVTVVDTTAPDVRHLPSPAAGTADPGGTRVTFPTPDAVDVVDPSPRVDCAPASGSVFPIGTTTVTCTATDDSGNAASASFAIVVTEETAPPMPPAPAATVRWDRPLGDGWTTGRLGRTVPVKVDIRIGHTRLVPGAGRPAPVLRVDRLDACHRGATVTRSAKPLALRWQGGRWRLQLRTGSLGAGCWRLVVAVDGADAGAAGLRLVDKRHCGHRGRGAAFAS